MTAPDLPAEKREELWRAMAEHVLRHMGYSDAEIERYTPSPDHEAMGCEFDGNHMRWDCYDENDTSRHPDHDEAGQVVEVIGVTLEVGGPVIAGWLAGAEAKARGIRFRVETACDGYEALTEADVPDEVLCAEDYIAGAAEAAREIRAVLRGEASGREGEL